ncbi:MAG TPA: CsbD family protein [Oligoflexia bacterium]|mgnify:CR=1 FL=1|nr:CsbD family protein [Oligoflexia bacterium]HMR24275.1 CsbD family protein [Oligoflexia bacterium]
MNKDIIKGNWKQIKGMVREKWGEISHDDIDRMEGNYDQIVGKIQETYGKSKEEAENEFNSWINQQNIHR